MPLPFQIWALPEVPSKPAPASVARCGVLGAPLPGSTGHVTMPPKYCPPRCFNIRTEDPCQTCWYFMPAGGEREPPFSPPAPERMQSHPPHNLGAGCRDRHHKNYHLLHPCEYAAEMAPAAPAGKTAKGKNGNRIGAAEAVLMGAAAAGDVSPSTGRPAVVGRQPSQAQPRVAGEGWGGRGRRRHRKRYRNEVCFKCSCHSCRCDISRVPSCCVPGGAR